MGASPVLPVPDTQVQSLGWEDPLEDGSVPICIPLHPTAVFLPGEFQVQRKLMGDSPWGSRVRNE